MARKSDAFIAVGAAASAARVVRKDFTLASVARVGSTALRKGMHSSNRGLVLRRRRRDRLPHAAQVRRAAPKTSFTLKLKPGERLEIREIRRTK